MMVRKDGRTVRARQATGFSLTELVVTMAVALVLVGIGMPAFLKAYRAYQLSTAAAQLGDILRLTRYEAIRLNKAISCMLQPTAGDPTTTSAWVDSNANGAQDPTEKSLLLGPGGNLVDSGGVPGTAGLIAAANITSGTTNEPPGGAVVQFDQRGAVVNPATVRIFYLSNMTTAESGYRAVLLMPAGSIQIWTADATGNWQQSR